MKRQAAQGGRRGFVVALAALIGALVLPGAAFAQDGERQTPPRERAIINLRIVVRPGQVIDRGNVIVKDGLIVAVGKDTAVLLRIPRGS